ncbi:MAG TPA: phosphodiester glycosidase family protein [Gemmatimonadaceae bacterium]|nr:phosphodiester glycosidase family protein [Gemmatimonadaceae bacterium]
MRLLLLGAAALAACSSPAIQSTPVIATLPLPFVADTQRAERVSDGVTRQFIYSASGPWAINVLEVDRRSCYSAVAVKGFPNSIGRRKTSDLLAELDSSGTVVGGVNADFFAPNGRPTNAHISRGRVITGPARQRPVLAFDSAGVAHIDRFQVAWAGLDHPFPAGWNRPLPNSIVLFDPNWGPVTDSMSGTIEVVVEGRRDSLKMISFDTLRSGVPIPSNGGVLVVHGQFYDFGLRLKDKPTMRLDMPLEIRPFHPMEAVGGRPVLVKDSTIVSEVDTEGAAGFATSRHPRTAVGIASNGNRLLLVTVDGRQKPYSDGMTLRELGNLMRALGARDAINLDGGGSTTLVYKDPRTKRLTVANRPSDPTGERAVGNALGIVKDCSR